ncbi:MAG: O-antigen ligase family protein [Patescibacteria group bacterium]|nr:O-antigen ligase family protein [Patescibacteria group bacterium]
MDLILKQLNRKTLAWLSLLFLILAVGLGFFTSRFDLVMVLGLLVTVIIFLVVYRSPFFGLLAVTFFLPFERIGSYDISSITIRASQLVTLALIIAWLIKGVVNRDLKFTKNPLLWPSLAFLSVNLMAITNALNLERSILVLAFTVFTMAFGYIIPQIITDEKKLRKLISILLVTTALVCLFGLWQFFGDMIGLPTTLTGLREHYTKSVFGFPRIQSTALEPLYFANFLLLPLALVYAFLVSRSSSLKLVRLMPLFILISLNMVLTVSRGGYLGTLVIVLALSLFYFKKVFRWKFIVPVAIGLVVVGFLAAWALGFGDIFQLNLDTFATHVRDAFSGPAYFERIETFEWAKQAWLDSPWIGIGPGQYGPYVAAHPFLEPTEGWKIVNNEFIELLAETGILGLASFLLILILLVVRSIKALVRASNSYLKAVMAALLAALFGVIAQYQTFSILYIMHVWFLIGLLLAVQNLILVPRKP